MTAADWGSTVSAESVEAAMEQLLAGGAGAGEPVSSQPEPPAEAPPVPPTPDPETPPPAAEQPTLTLADGTTVTLEDAERWLEFSATLQDPRFIRAYQEAFSEAEPPPVAPAPQQPPAQDAPPHQLSEELQYELDNNPLAKLLWSRLQEIDSTVNQTRGRVDEFGQTLQLTEQRNAYSIVNQARENFAREYQLSPEEIGRVYDATIRMYDLDKLVSMPVNPLTGNAEQPDPVRRLEEAFTYVYRAVPEFQEREFTRRTEEATREAERKAKLSALSTSGSSAPPPTSRPAPTNPADRRSALADDIAALQAGTSIQPE